MARRPREFEVAGNGKFGRLVIGVLLAGVLVVAYAAFQAKFHLRAEMPPEFVEDSPSWSAQKQAQEARMARAYWQCALAIQWQYGYGKRLPDDPPPEFLITTQEVGTAAFDAGSRLRYWRRLQHVWYLPDSWEKTYTLDAGSLTASLRSAGDWLEQEVRRVGNFSW
jgi:hypothetical protein